MIMIWSGKKGTLSLPYNGDFFHCSEVTRKQTSLTTKGPMMMTKEKRVAQLLIRFVMRETQGRKYAISWDDLYDRKARSLARAPAIIAGFAVLIIRVAS